MTTLYTRLAAVGIKKNGKSYVPYMLTSAVMIMIFYIVAFLAGNELLDNMRGGNAMSEMMSMGIVIMAVFSSIFLFYTNSFLIKRRKKEFGLYNILGLGKLQIARVLIWETLLVYAVSMILGLGLGILFSKLAELLATKMLGEELNYVFSVDIKAIVIALLWFAAVFTAILLNSLRQLYFSKPVELLHSENTGEKPPRTNVPFAVLGIAILGTAYYMAVSIEDPMAAILGFVAAVIMVIVATYMLFIAGSVAMCRILQKNKKYYYRTNHFVSVSQMAFRMRRNGAGLASICILATMVLVTISSTSSLLIGMNDYANAMYPRDIELTIYMRGGDVFDEYYSAVRGAAAELGKQPKNEMISRKLDISYWLLEKLDIKLSGNAYFWGSVFIAGEHEATAGLNLGKRGIAVVEKNTRYFAGMEKLTVEGMGEFDLTHLPESAFPEYDKFAAADGADVTILGLFVSDTDVFWELCGNNFGLSDEALVPKAEYRFDIEGTDSEREEVIRAIERYGCIGEISERTNSTVYTASRLRFKEDELGLYGGLFFLGVLLGSVFLLAAALIMYYKQISEGFEDAQRFEILRKVGMSGSEIKSAINSQVLTVFFLPLIAAGVHMAFAFPILTRMLRLFGYTNAGLFALVVLGCFAAFAAIYVLVYKATSKSYLSIVSGKS